ncbi:hypothetical protein WJX84_009909 [Apatococcus fuscideae]|uniref:Uncharacterized protein n=1 Tax=Apatococcus fuscideae TaxID=2026836 RepID=A0AAW1T2D1_9CHLO
MALLASVPTITGTFSQTQQRHPKVQLRSTVSCSAEPTDRRRALQLLTSLPLLAAAAPALALGADRDISDEPEGSQSMDQARDTDENQKARFSMTESEGMTPDMHKKRIKESLSRLQKNVASDMKKKHFPAVSNDLRGQMSTLRFDLDALNASISDKAARKKAQKVQNEAMKALETLDYLARTNAANDIEKAYQVAFTQLQQVVSSLG